MNESKRLARAFRGIPSGDVDVDGKENSPSIHVVSLTYPPDDETLSKMKYLRRYRSFIHESRVFSKDSIPVRELYDSLIPEGCKVQYFQVEYSDDTKNAFVNIDSLNPNVSSLHVSMKIIREDDVFTAMSMVKKQEDFGIRISGWHDFNEEYLKFMDDTIGDSKGLFHLEIGRSHIVFWTEEKY